MYSIYKHTNQAIGKSYIGYTQLTPEKRLQKHCVSSRRNSETAFHTALREFPTVWTHSVIKRCKTLEQAKLYERAAILLYGTFPCGYNMTKGGNGGPKWTKEMRAKKSAVMMGNTNSLGYKHSTESRAINSASKIGIAGKYERTAEIRAKNSASKLADKAGD